MKEHGRLLALKHKLVNVVDLDEPLSMETLQMFQLKDLECAEGQVESDHFSVAPSIALKGMDIR